MIHVALVRAINLAGHNRVAMADLRDLLGGLGLQNPRSLLASGNLVFGSEGRTPAQLEALLEDAASTELGLESAFLVRTGGEWKGIIERNPFPDEADRDPRRLQALLLKSAPVPGGLPALRDAISGPESVRAGDGVVYAYYPEGIGRSRLTTALIEKHLGTPVTGRNWNTVLKLGALVDG